MRHPSGPEPDTMKHLLPTLLLLLTGLVPALLRASGNLTPLAELMAESDSPAPLVRELNETVIFHLGELLNDCPDFLPAYLRLTRRIVREADQAGDIPLAQKGVALLACAMAQTTALEPGALAELASLTTPGSYLAVFWAEALLAADGNPHLVLALLNTYTDAATPNVAVYRARALLRLGRELDALHAVFRAFDPGSRHAFPDPVLFALVGDICYRNGLRREALLAWHKAIRAYDDDLKNPNPVMPVADRCLLFNFEIAPLRRKFRALKVLLK